MSATMAWNCSIRSLRIEPDERVSVSMCCCFVGERLPI
jgi:hypothetical protein